MVVDLRVCPTPSAGPLVCFQSTMLVTLIMSSQEEKRLFLVHRTHWFPLLLQNKCHKSIKTISCCLISRQCFCPEGLRRNLAFQRSGTWSCLELRGVKGLEWSQRLRSKCWGLRSAYKGPSETVGLWVSLPARREDSFKDNLWPTLDWWRWCSGEGEGIPMQKLVWPPLAGRRKTVAVYAVLDPG